MAVGKPIIATNIEGYASVVDDGRQGLLVPPKNDKALSSALVTLLQDEKMRESMGANGRAKAQTYGWEAVASRVFDYYKQVLKGFDIDGQT